MTIYIFIPILLLFLTTIKGKGKIYFALIFLFFINVSRDYSVGYDYGINYKRLYDQKNAYSYNNIVSDDIDTSDLLLVEKESVELGWSMIEYIGKINKLPFSFVNFIAAIIIFITLTISIRQSPFPIISILLYVLLFRYYASFNIIRQSISAIIFIASIPYIAKRQFIKYLICCLLAASFHLSSLLMLVFYFLPKIRISFNFSVLLIIAFYVISALNVDMKIFSWLYDSGYMFASYAKYLAIENEYNYNIILLYIPSILLLIPYLLLNFRLKETHLDVYQLLYVFAIIISILSVHYEVLFRFNEYFLNSLIITLPILLRKQNKSLYSIKGCLTLSCCILYYSMYMFLNANAIWPYSLIFFN